MRYPSAALHFCQAMLLVGLTALTCNLPAADFQQLNEANYASLVPAGKETDAIYGDWVLRNDQIVVIFLDVDGSGFKANRDDLGVPFMLPVKEDSVNSDAK